VLRRLDRAVDVEAAVLAHEAHEGAQPRRLERLALEIGEQRERRRRLQERQVMPALEVRVEPARHRQHVAEGVAVRGAATERGRDALAHELRVEGVAGDADAPVPSTSARARPPPGSSRSTEKSLVPPPKSPINTSSGPVMRSP
jgi:hypothetical protein